MTEQTEGRGDLILILSEVSKRVRAERLATAAFAAEKSRAAELESVINQMDEGVVIVDRERALPPQPARRRVSSKARAGELRDGVKALVVDMTLRDNEGRVLAAEETPVCRALVGGEHVSAEQYKIVRARRRGTRPLRERHALGGRGRARGGRRRRLPRHHARTCASTRSCSRPTTACASTTD